jgi:hypothetical protein
MLVGSCAIEIIYRELKQICKPGLGLTAQLCQIFQESPGYKTEQNKT